MTTERWFNLERQAGDVPGAIQARVRQIYRVRSRLFESYSLLDAYYDAAGGEQYYGVKGFSQVEQNVIASTTDTVTAAIGVRQVTPKVVTKDAPWERRRRAVRTSHYMAGLGKHCGTREAAMESIKYGTLKGLGAVRVGQRAGELKAWYVPVNELAVPDFETRDGRLLELIHAHWRDRRELQYEYPKFAEQLAEATTDYSDEWFASLGNSEYVGDTDSLYAYEAWRLPTGKKGSKGYKLGRHVLVVNELILVDEDYEDDEPPFCFFRWSTRPRSWYPMGAGHRVMGHQCQINRYERQTDRQLQQQAYPTTYVHASDASLSARSRNDIGTIAVYRHSVPKTVIPPSVSPEMYHRVDKLEDKAYEVTGVSRMAATSMKPAGLDSGIALREYRDQTTQRFAIQEVNYEEHLLDIHFMCFRMACRMGDNAPTVAHKSRFGTRVVREYSLAGADLEVLRNQLEAVSPVANTPAGRKQFATELAQAGLISADELRRLLDHPDLENVLSLYTAASDDIDATIEAILDGEDRWPEPAQNLELGKWRVQQTILRIAPQGAPRSVLDRLYRWMTIAAELMSKAKMAAAPAGAPPQMAEELTQQAPALPGMAA